MGPYRKSRFISGAITFGASLGYVGSLTLTATKTSSGASFAQTTITVNSDADINYRDTLLTLREAILIANGRLGVSALTQGELQQINGSPGAGKNDHILFDTSIFPPPPSPARVIVISSTLPLLTSSNNGDVIDATNAGVILLNAKPGTNINGLIVDGGSGITIRGLEIAQFNNGILIQNLKNNALEIAIELNRIHGSPGPDGNGIALIRGTNAKVRIANNQLFGNFSHGINLSQDVKNSAPLVTIAGNTISENLKNGIMVKIAYSRIEGNEISSNHWNGVTVDGAGADENSIRGNRTAGNTGPGIVLMKLGNNGKQPPVITMVSLREVGGRAVPGDIVDVFASADETDEGHLFLGSTMADSSGDWTFLGEIPTGWYVTATATDAPPGGDTSEYSAAVQLP